MIRYKLFVFKKEHEIPIVPWLLHLAAVWFFGHRLDIHEAAVVDVQLVRFS